jgi:hypothetical protein
MINLCWIGRHGAGIALLCVDKLTYTGHRERSASAPAQRAVARTALRQQTTVAAIEYVAYITMTVALARAAQ